MDHAAAFQAENRAFADLFRGLSAEAIESTPVPTCPGWTLKQLLRHMGGGDRWAAQIARDRLQESLDPRAVEGGKPPTDSAAVPAWLTDGARDLVDAVQATGPATTVWTFLGPRPAGWWIRRRLHETAVHRADAAIALGVLDEFALKPDVAADAIDEWLERVVVQAGRDGAPLPLDAGTTLHLHATDPGLGEAGEWTVGVDGGKLAWAHEHGKATVAIRGRATDLLLTILRRVPLGDAGVEAFGDEAVLAAWLDRTPL